MDHCGPEPVEQEPLLTIEPGNRNNYSPEPEEQEDLFSDDVGSQDAQVVLHLCTVGKFSIFNRSHGYSLEEGRGQCSRHLLLKFTSEYDQRHYFQLPPPPPVSKYMQKVCGWEGVGGGGVGC
jgi:hypothetical protein